MKVGNLFQTRYLSVLRLDDVFVLRVGNDVSVQLSTARIAESLMTKVSNAIEWYILGKVKVNNFVYLCLDNKSPEGFELEISVIGVGEKVLLSAEEATKLLLFLTDRLDDTPPPDYPDPAPFKHDK